MASNPRTINTAPYDQRIRRMTKAGKSVAWIAKRLGISEHAVRKSRASQGIERTYPNDAKIRKLVREGATNGQIAEQLGMNTGGVSRAIQRLGLEVVDPNEENRRALDAAIEEALANGWTVRELAERRQVTKEAVRMAAKRRGVTLARGSLKIDASPWHAQVERMTREGATVHQIVETLGISRHVVRRARRNLGVQSGQHLDVRIGELIADGRDGAEIARICDVSKGRVVRTANRLGIELHDARARAAALTEEAIGMAQQNDWDGPRVRQLPGIGRVGGAKSPAKPGRLVALSSQGTGSANILRAAQGQRA